MTWKRWVEHTSTQPTLTAVMEARSRHWERYLHDRCPDDDCELHPIPMTDLFDRLDPDQGFLRKGNRIP